MTINDYIEEHLLSLGATPQYTAYRYLISAIALSVQDPSILTGITTKLYPIISEKYNTTPANVERSIRTIISVIWCDCDKDTLRELMGRGFEIQPGNAKFIAVLSRKIAIGYRRRRSEAASANNL